MMIPYYPARVSFRVNSSEQSMQSTPLQSFLSINLDFERAV